VKPVIAILTIMSLLNISSSIGGIIYLCGPLVLQERTAQAEKPTEQVCVPCCSSSLEDQPVGCTPAQQDQLEDIDSELYCEITVTPLVRLGQPCPCSWRPPKFMSLAIERRGPTADLSIVADAHFSMLPTSPQHRAELANARPQAVHPTISATVMTL